jgi:hypothetical protein
MCDKLSTLGQPITRVGRLPKLLSWYIRQSFGNIGFMVISGYTVNNVYWCNRSIGIRRTEGKDWKLKEGTPENLS